MRCQPHREIRLVEVAVYRSLELECVRIVDYVALEYLGHANMHPRSRDGVHLVADVNVRLACPHSASKHAREVDIGVVWVRQSVDRAASK